MSYFLIFLDSIFLALACPPFRAYEPFVLTRHLAFHLALMFFTSSEPSGKRKSVLGFLAVGT